MVKCSPTCPVFLATTPLSLLQLEAIQQDKLVIQPPMGMTDLEPMGIHQTQAVKPQGPQVVVGLQQVLSLTQFYSVEFLLSRKGSMKRVRFQQTHNQGLRQLLLTVSWDLRA